MQDGDFTSEGRFLGGVFLVLFLVVVLAAMDVAADLQGGTTLQHVLIEGGVIASGLVGSVFIARRLLFLFRSAKETWQEAHALAERLEVTEAEASRWRMEARELLDGLGAALDRQFERWALSPAEKEIALLLLKGLSHKEIARVRSTTEATARQQARAVYRKAALMGRNELAAFFLEDLLLPVESVGDGSSPPQAIPDGPSGQGSSMARS